MRLFVAVEVPADVRAAVDAAVAPLRTAAPKLRWVAPERYHLTLVFLGAVDEALLPGVSAGMQAGCAGAAGFTLALDGTVGTFGRRVLWAGVAPSPELTTLAGRVTAALRSVVGLADEQREFSAHLTLARAKREPVRSRLVKGVSVPALSWPVGRVVLLRSAGGYEVVAEAVLEG